MTRDNILFTVCGFIIGLVLGAVALGPVFYEKGVTSKTFFAKGSAAPSSTPVTSTAAPNAPMQQGGGDPAVMQGVLQQIAQLKGELERNPNNFEAAVQLGNMYMDARKYPQAIGYYEQALKVKDHDDVRTDLGICYRATNQPEKALAEFEKVQTRDPQHWQSLFNKAVVLVDLKRNAEARVIVDKLMKEHPEAEEVKQFDAVLKQLGA